VRVTYRVLSVLFLLSAAGPAAAATSYEIRPGDEGNLVRFRSKAPLETIIGTTREASGSIEADLDRLSDSVRVLVEVDLASLDTGIDLRNRHMRENHLHTDRFPKAVFRAGRIEGKPVTAIPPGGRARFSLAGEFTLHGVTKAIQVPVDAVRMPGDSLIVETSFEVLLSDYEIPRPEFLILRLDEKQHVEVRLTAVPPPPRKKPEVEE
jgi:polyisoprenoid-binding protein YceI